MAEGVQNLKVCIQATKEVVETVGVILEDGKVSLMDLVKAPALFKSVNAFVAAVVKCAPEVKDMDAAEAQALVNDLVPLIALIASKFGYKVA